MPLIRLSEYCKFYPYCKKGHHKKNLCKFTFTQCEIYVKFVREFIRCEHGTIEGSSHCIKCKGVDN